jgi:hypothetical protein
MSWRPHACGDDPTRRFQHGDYEAAGASPLAWRWQRTLALCEGRRLWPRVRQWRRGLMHRALLEALR